MRFFSGARRSWVAAYLAVTLACTTGVFILSQRLAEQTGLRRQVWLANDFQGPPVINDVASEPALDFLVNDARLPREFFSARWRGYWYLPSSRSFILHVEADDYADLWIDGEQRFTRSSAAERAVRLDAGVHELQIAYQQYAGATNLAFTEGTGDGYPLPLRTGYLFPDEPEPNLLRLAGIVDRLRLTVGILWAAGALAGAVFFILAAPTRLERPRIRIPIAVLLGLLFVGHVGVFGWRSVTFDRRVTGDSMNYIDVARNLSAGEGLVQSAAGYNQPTFWAEDFTPHFPEKTRAGHNSGYSVLIAAVAAVTGLEHADAAFLIGPAAYAAALASAFLFASRLLGPAAGLLAAAFVAHQVRWIFLRTWTEPVVIALLLALLALLACGATPRRAVVGGLIAGVALLVRSGFVPILALGGLACVLGGDNRLRQLLLYGGVASIALAGLLLGEGQAYPPQVIEAGEFPRRELSSVLGELFHQSRWDIAGLVLLVGCAGWRAARDGRPIVPTRARTACLLAAAYVAGSCVFLSAAQLLTAIDPIGDRLLAPTRTVTAVISALLVWRLCPERWRLSVAIVVFAATMALATAGDTIVQAHTGTAQRIYASSARVLVGRNMTARILPADGDRSDYTRRIAGSPRRLWVSRNVTARDLVVSTGAMDLPYFFRQQVPATVSFSPQPYFPEIPGAKFNAVFLARCDRYDNLYLILSKFRRRWGRFALDLLAGTPTEPGTPAASFSRVADLPDSVVFRFTACEG